MKKTDINTKREREKEMVSLMIDLYCRKNHGCKDGICTQCQELKEYAKMRSDKCPFMETKTFCSNCKVHCYKPEMREKIRKVMCFFRSENDFLSSSFSDKTCNRNEKRKEKIGA